MLGGWLKNLQGQTSTPGSQICDTTKQIISIFSGFDTPAAVVLEW